MSVMVRSICGSSSTIRTWSGCASACENVIQYLDQFFRREGLLDRGVDQSLLIALAVAVAGCPPLAENQCHAWTHSFDRQNRFFVRDAVETKIEHYCGGRGFLECVESFLQTRGFECIVSSLLEAPAEVAQQRSVVRDEQHRWHLLRCLIQHLDEAGENDWLRQYLDRAFTLRFGDDVRRGIGGHQHHANVRAKTLHLPKSRHAVDAGHLDVHQHGAVRLFANFLDGRLAAVSPRRLPAMHAHDVGQRPYHLPIIVDDQNPTSHAASALAIGSSTETVEPLPGSLAAEIPPPLASARLRETARPSPIPRALVVYSGSNILSSCSRVMPTPVSITSSLTLPLPL